MDKYALIQKNTLTNIADSIRAKTGKTEKIDPLYMPDEISTISGGGGGVNPGVIDGTLAVITAEDLAGVTRIRDHAFYWCNNLEAITIPDSVTSIGDSAFYSCDNLTDITIPDSVTSIGSGAFCDCYRLASVTIGNSVTTIGASAFGYCDNLTDIVIPDSVTTISSYMFNECNSLTSVTFGNSVTSIGGYAFYNCASLTSVTIPDSVTTIGNWAFENCTSLATITIGDSVTTIGKGVFNGTAIYNDDSNWVDGVLYIDNCLIYVKSSGLPSNYTIKDGTRLISGSAFSYCSSLISLAIPGSVTTISDDAFKNCTSLTEIIIEGDTLKVLEDSLVFSSTPISNGTGYIYIKPTSPDVDEAALVEAYKTATNWAVYADQIRPYSEYPI